MTISTNNPTLHHYTAVDTVAGTLRYDKDAKVEKYHDLYSTHYQTTESVYPLSGYHDSLYPADYSSDAQVDDAFPELWISTQKLRIEQFLSELSGGAVNAYFVANTSRASLDPRHPPYWRINLNPGGSYAENHYITFDAGVLGKYPTLAEESAARMGLKDPRGWELWPATKLFPLMAEWYHASVTMGHEYRLFLMPTKESDVVLHTLAEVDTNSGQSLTLQKEENRDDYLATRDHPVYTANPGF